MSSEESWDAPTGGVPGGGSAAKWIVPLLAVTSAAAAGAMWWRGLASALEAVSFVTGACCVWLTVRESVWNFPVGLANNVTFAAVFLHVGLLADAGLQVVYVVLTLAGWYMWLYGGRRHTALRVSRVGAGEAIAVILCGAGLTIGLWRLVTFAGGVSPFWDAITTALSLCAQWLLNRKRLENWYFWIAADLIYVPLYAYKGLFLTSGLYATFLLMCVMGIIQWRATLRAQRNAGAEAAEPSAAGAV
jgi:nicotinamide mononucleotide transporter